MADGAIASSKEGNMTPPLQVTLPPWCRGDGKPCKEPGWYACRTPGKDVGEYDMVKKNKDSPLYEEADYAGPLPIEFIETPPEPEPLTLPGLETRTVKMDGKRWCVRVISEDGCSSVVSVVHENKATAIEAFNAAVRALEGK